MMGYKAKIKDGVKGKAIHIVPISESPVDRAVFNGVVNVYYERELENAEEIERVSDLMQDHQKEISKALEEVGIVSLTADEDMLKIEKLVQKYVGENKQWEAF